MVHFLLVTGQLGFCFLLSGYRKPDEVRERVALRKPCDWVVNAGLPWVLPARPGGRRGERGHRTAGGRLLEETEDTEAGSPLKPSGGHRASCSCAWGGAGARHLRLWGGVPLAQVTHGESGIWLKLLEGLQTVCCNRAPLYAPVRHLQGSGLTQIKMANIFIS